MPPPDPPAQGAQPGWKQTVPGDHTFETRVPGHTLGNRGGWTRNRPCVVSAVIFALQSTGMGMFGPTSLSRAAEEGHGVPLRPRDTPTQSLSQGVQGSPRSLPACVSCPHHSDHSWLCRVHWAFPAGLKPTGLGWGSPHPQSPNVGDTGVQESLRHEQGEGITRLGCPMSDFRCLETDLAWPLFGPCFPRASTAPYSAQTMGHRLCLLHQIGNFWGSSWSLLQVPGPRESSETAAK